VHIVSQSNRIQQLRTSSAADSNRNEKAGAASQPDPAEMPDRRGAPKAFTIGHSTRTILDFIALLRAHGVEKLIDVRTVPSSRHNPQFNREELSHSLHSARLHYTYMPGLGGFRRPKAAGGDVSTSANAASGELADHRDNSGWRNASFRGYADYMQTAEFEQNLEALIALAQAESVAVMCAEAVPWRCHRSLIADALTVRGFEVREIASAASTRPHVLTRFAKVQGIRIWYPPEFAATDV